MRVALLVDQYFNPSGVGVFTRELVRALIAHGEHEYLLAYAGSGGSRRLRANHDVEVVTLPDRRVLWPSWHLTRMPVVEHFTGPVDLVHALSASVRVPTRAPLVATVHDLAVIDRPDDVLWRRRWFGREKLRDFRDSGALLYAISRATRQRLARFLGVAADTIPVIPHGVDPDVFYPSHTEAQRTTRRLLALPEVPYFLFVGVVSPRKNLETLLDAFSRFASEGHPHHLVLTSPSPGFRVDALRAHIERLQLEHRVQFVGAVPPEHMAGLYGGATALVYPSWYEGFGFPVLEAMACGVPVVCSNSTSMPELAEDAGFLVPPGDVVAWTEALERVVSDSAVVQRNTEAGLARAAGYRWADTATRTAALYQSVVSG